ncbi:MAG: TOBE domain-containing protein, partial [Actinomycetales bacterium]
PLAALDIETRQSVRVELQHHLEDFTGSAILVTHDPLDAMLLADRVVVLEQGSIVQQGTPTELARRPATAYVAALMGVNLLPGTAEAGVVHLMEGGSLQIRDEQLTGPCLAMIRPEAITVSLEQPHGSARNCWPGTVAAVEALHDRVKVHVDGRPGLIATITPAAVAELRLQRGTGVWLSVKAMEVDAYPRPVR